MDARGGNRVEIRPVKRDDAPQLVPLVRSYIVDFYQRPDPGPGSIEKLIANLLDHPDQGIQFIAVDGARAVGFATLYFTLSTLRMKRVAILNDLFVHPDVRRQKIGESIFRYCLDYVKRNGFAYMQWETAKDNVAAQALYNKLGGRLSDWLVYTLELDSRTVGDMGRTLPIMGMELRP